MWTDFDIGVDSRLRFTRSSRGSRSRSRLTLEIWEPLTEPSGNFTCSGLPPGTTYSFNPTQVPGSGSTMLTIATAPVGQAQRRASNQSRGVWWMASAILSLLGICLIGMPSWRRRGSSARARGCFVPDPPQLWWRWRRRWRRRWHWPTSHQQSGVLPSHQYRPHSRPQALCRRR